MKNMIYLCVAVFLTACSSTSGYFPESSKTENFRVKSDVCMKWAEQSAKCDQHNRDYSGIQRREKVAACMKARGFPLHKSHYCQ